MRHAIRALSVAVLLAVPAVARPAEAVEADVRQVLERFVAAQNAHDLRAVGDLLRDDAGFLWITRGNVIWGRDEALKRFETIYAGTWKLEPDLRQLRVLVLDANAVQLLVPITFTMGPAGQPPQVVQFHMNQTLVRTPAGWRIASILPIPLPKP
jgi:uncharacterized protein (TIGR02246 family)